MKLSYILQIKDLCIMLFFGFLVGILYGILNIPNRIKKKLIYQIFSDIIFSVIFSGAFIILINLLNNGELRTFLLAGYSLGLLIERITLGKIFAKGYKNVYTLIIKAIKYLGNSKFGRMIFK